MVLNSCIFFARGGGTNQVIFLFHLSTFFFTALLLSSYLYSHPSSSPVLSASLFLFPTANKLCMPSPTHGVLHWCTICSKLLLFPFPISLLASQSFPFLLFSFSLLISLSSLSPYMYTPTHPHTKT